MELSENQVELRDAAEQACERAYAPYSHFRVGAAVRSASGRIYSGCNVEIASYPLGLCAERNAIFSGVSAEGPGIQLLEIAIATAHGKVAAPCGACRQVLHEFGPQATVILCGLDSIEQFAVAELLPHPFGPDDLKKA